MDPLHWEGDPPELRSPILVAAFSGWNDAAGAASTALQAVAASLETELVARMDPEEFYDFQANRPIIHLSDGRSRRIEWPENTLIAARAPTAERDLLLLAGTEPSVRWRSFCDAILDGVERCGTTTMVTLGALLADVAHTRPVPITGLATDPELIERLGFEEVSYEGPTGVVGVLHDRCRHRDMTAASLWAAVPHYAAAIPNPKAALALLRNLEGLIGIAIEGSELESAAETFEHQVDEAVAANPEIKELVERLEREQAEVLDFGPDFPSGEAIARELQRFLRQRDD